MSTATAVIVCALSLLGGAGKDIHPIALVEIAPPEASRFTEGFVSHNPDTIHILTSSSVFRDAMTHIRDGCRVTQALNKLASIIVHEEWHIRNGSDEQGAYDAQLATLSILGVKMDSPLFMEVHKTMVAVVRARERSLKRLALLVTAAPE